MLCKVFCACCRGLEVFTVTVEVDVSDGINFFLVGLADSAVKESQQRIGSAISKFGYRIPGKKIVINMAPANIRKEGSAYDLAIAVAIVSASGQISLSSLNDYIIMGELALDGTLRPVTGALPIILHAKECGYKGCILPLESAKEGAEIDGIKVYGAETFKDVVDILQDPSLCNNKLVKYNVVEYAGSADYDFADIKGQEQAKKGLEIAASGGHNVIMIGAPGTGKTYMAKCLNSIMPKLSKRESLETSKIYSVAGLLGDNLGLIKERPFRQPHHTSSIQSLAGALGMPGEVSLAHNGILFADELAEFPRSLLELLRQPLEDREIQICRARTRVCYPASFMFIAAMNPCPCGYYNQPGKVCNCSVSSIMKYRNKLSGPLMDRIDIQLRVLPVSASEIVGESGKIGESSRQIAQRVKKAREIQYNRYKGENFYTNSQIPAGLISKYCSVGEREKSFLKEMISRMHLSARGYSRVLKVSRTIADIEGAEKIEIKHIAQAIQYKISDELL